MFAISEQKLTLSSEKLQMMMAASLALYWPFSYCEMVR